MLKINNKNKKPNRIAPLGVSTGPCYCHHQEIKQRNESIFSPSNLFSKSNGVILQIL
jgi:hypothetical protein